MNFNWEITENDIMRVKNFISRNKNNFVHRRREKNIEKKFIDLDNNSIIKTMLMCLLTIQQRSGPHSKVSKFLNTSEFPATTVKLSRVDNIVF